jgi:hypothetical protein
MALARVVTFEDVDAGRMAELAREIESGEPPEGLPVSEMLVLHDADGGKALVVMFFENDDDYRRGHEMMDAMPVGDTPGRRTSVSKYDVAARRAR